MTNALWSQRHTKSICHIFFGGRYKNAATKPNVFLMKEMSNILAKISSAKFKEYQF